MATGQTPWTKNVLCRYYKHGACNLGDNCSYGHDFGTAKEAMTCRYYLKGHCHYGSSCRYDHIRPKGNPVDANKKKTKDPTPKLPAVTPIPHSTKLDTSPRAMVSLTHPPAEPQDQTVPSQSPPATLNPSAAEFVPGCSWSSAVLPPSYVDAAKVGVETDDDVTALTSQPANFTELCPYALQGECRYGDSCCYVHGLMCEDCGRPALHPEDLEQQDAHRQECIAEHERAMEESFAIQHSKDKQCGVCMEVVWEKEIPSERRFGILSNCSHVFCLSCIRKWRTAKSFENRIVRACPECRVLSDFVTPSKFWVDEIDAKEKLISGYKANLQTKPCKYFDNGKGECPFNENCFYAHKYPDGRVASPKPRRRRRRQNGQGQLSMMQELVLWEFLQARDEADAGSALLLAEDQLRDLIIQFALLTDDSSTSSDSD